MNMLILGIVIALKIAVMIMYGLDKFKACKGSWRTPEKTLLIGGLLAPFGAVLGMHVFHHKTRKPLFKLNYVFLLIHIVLIIYFCVL